MLKLRSRFLNRRVYATDGYVGQLSDIVFQRQDGGVAYLIATLSALKGLQDVQIRPSWVRGPKNSDRRLQLSLSCAELRARGAFLSDVRPSLWQRAWDLTLPHPDSISWYDPAPLTSDLAKADQPALLLDEEQLSAAEVVGHLVRSVDGKAIGVLSDWLICPRSWTVRFAIIGTGLTPLGRGQVLVPLSEIGAVDITRGELTLDLPREAVMGAPRYESHTADNGAFQAGVRGYYDCVHRYFRTPARLAVGS